MLCKIPHKDLWIKHIEARFGEAQSEINLISKKAKLDPLAAEVFVPDHAQIETLENADPFYDHIRFLFFNDSTDPKTTWPPKQGMYDYISNWLSQKWQNYWLIGPMEFNDLGSKNIAHVPHINYQEKPFVFTKIDAHSADELELLSQYAAWTCSWRTLAVVVSENEAKQPFEPVKNGIFACDAFTRASWIVVPFSTKE